MISLLYTWYYFFSALHNINETAWCDLNHAILTVRLFHVEYQPFLFAFCYSWLISCQFIRLLFDSRSFPVISLTISFILRAYAFLLNLHFINRILYGMRLSCLKFNNYKNIKLFVNSFRKIFSKGEFATNIFDDFSLKT